MNQLIPAHVMIVLEMFYEAATFDLLPMHWLTDPIEKALAPGEKSEGKNFQHNEQTVDAGYETANPFFNLTYPLAILAFAIVI